MPDGYQPLTDEWVETGDMRTVLNRIKTTAVANEAHLLDETQTSLELKFGSRTMFQLLGAFLEKGRRYAPLQAHVHVTDSRNGKSKVQLVVEPHHGWPRVRTTIGETAFRERRAQVVESLRQFDDP